MDHDEVMEHLKRVAEDLGEHFDAVQILATRHEGTDSHSFAMGAGNWYARQGLAHEFINRDRAHDQAIEIANEITFDPPDDGEEWKQADVQ